MCQGFFVFFLSVLVFYSKLLKICCQRCFTEEIENIHKKKEKRRILFKVKAIFSQIFFYCFIWAAMFYGQLRQKEKSLKFQTLFFFALCFHWPY
jgi:hypothetical protein